MAWGTQPRGNKQTLMVAQGMGMCVAEVTGRLSNNRFVKTGTDLWLTGCRVPSPAPLLSLCTLNAMEWYALLIPLFPAECLKGLVQLLSSEDPF